jgi:hypothetical protein
MKPVVISMVVGAALCSVMSVPASAMPMSNLAAAASDLALGQSVRYGRYHHRYRHYAIDQAITAATEQAITAAMAEAMDQAPRSTLKAASRRNNHRAVSTIAWSRCRPGLSWP